MPTENAALPTITGHGVLILRIPIAPGPRAMLKIAAGALLEPYMTLASHIEGGGNRVSDRSRT